MQIHGLNKTTLLDYPEHVAATIFTGGCNFRCPFCHNGELVLHPLDYPLISKDEVMTFLKKRRGILTGVCITGGEPTLQPDLIDFISEIKKIGYLVKLDTNGYRPDVLQELMDEKYIDYIAMDIKNSKEKYQSTAGLNTTGSDIMDMSYIDRSVELIMGGNIPYEFRTTVVKQFHTAADFESIAKWLHGANAYFLQAYKDNENVIQKGLSSYEKEELETFLTIMKPHMKKVEIRGID